MASGKDYCGPAKNSMKVGKYIAKELIVKKLVKILGQKPSKLHAIGFSLGAHLVGHLGRTVYKEIGEKIGRITGLDPARPFFILEEHKENRLNKNDADFVDIIHTNSGSLLQGFLLISIAVIT